MLSSTKLQAGIALIGAVARQATSAILSGTIVHRRLALATVNLTSVQAGATKLVGGMVQNTSASTKYLKLYDKASAPVVETDTPVFTIAVPAATVLPLANLLGDTGHSFTLGLAYAMTGAIADTDNTALAANDMILHLLYA